MLTRIESTLGSIKSVLLNNEKIRQLVYNDSNAALSLPVPTEEQTEKYITLHPIFDFENKDDYSQNTIINIYFSDGSPVDDETAIDGTIRINIVVNVDKWDLLDNKIRPLQIANLIIKLLNNKKFSVSNELYFDSMQELIISKQLVGYALLFSVTDGSGEIDTY